MTKEPSDTSTEDPLLDLSLLRHNYEQTLREQQQALKVQHKRIASAYTLSALSILTFIFAFPVSISVVSLITANGHLMSISVCGAISVACIFSIYCIVRLAKSLHYGNTAICFFALCIPLTWAGIIWSELVGLILAGLIPLFAVYFYAFGTLDQAGYNVGIFFGADMRQFDAKIVNDTE